MGRNARRPYTFTLYLEKDDIAAGTIFVATIPYEGMLVLTEATKVNTLLEMVMGRESRVPRDKPKTVKMIYKRKTYLDHHVTLRPKLKPLVPEK